MRRTRLVWFALGALAVVLSLAISGWLSGRKDNVQPFVVLSSPHVEVILPGEGAGNGEADNINSRNESQRLGEAIRDCGFKKFEIAMSVRDLKYIIPINPESSSALECVFQSLRGSERAESIKFKAP